MALPASKTSLAKPLTSSDGQPLHVEEFLVELADALNTTLDLDTLLSRVAEMVKRVIPYEIFAILLLNEKTQDLRQQLGEAIRAGDEGKIDQVTRDLGQVTQQRQAITPQP